MQKDVKDWLSQWKSAADMELELIDLKDLFIDSTYCRDGIHPQRTGARMLADALFSGIRW